MGVALVLASLFGPFGLLYASVTGGIVMMVVYTIVAIFTLGFGLFFVWPIPIIWAAIAINKEREQQARVANQTAVGAPVGGPQGHNTLESQRQDAEPSKEV